MAVSPPTPRSEPPHDGGGPDRGGAIRFPHAARLELDELLEQLVDRAHDVQRSQSRLRGLLAAYREVTRAVDQEVVLRHVVEAARELVGARYAALGVIRQGHLVRFLHTGMDEDAVAAIGDLPAGKGVLGLLVEHPQSLRLADIAGHPTSVGFPEHHPPMRSFLGVPVRIGDRVFGNLYLADKHGAAEFTGDDEELVAALAGVAGTAIENAMLFEDTRRRQAWQAAMVEITTMLIADGDPDEALRHVVRLIMDKVAAAGGGVTVPTDDPQVWRMCVGEGLLARWQDIEVPLDASLTGTAVTERALVVITDPGIDPRTEARAAQAVGVVGQTMGMPMMGDQEPVGVLIVARRPGAPDFDELDRELFEASAAQAGLALKLVQAHRDAEALHLLAERQQIGEDLQHHVIRACSPSGWPCRASPPGPRSGPPARRSKPRSARSTRSSATSARPCSTSTTGAPAGPTSTPTPAPASPTT